MAALIISEKPASFYKKRQYNDEITLERTIKWQDLQDIRDKHF